MTSTPNTESKNNTGSKGRMSVIVALVLCLVGLGISIELTRIHFYAHTDPLYHSICAVNEHVNCETVAHSPFSVFLNVPVSVWGILGYCLMAGLLGWGLSRRRLHPSWPMGATMLTVFCANIASVILAYISVTRIDAICLFCTALYALNFGLLVVLGVWAMTHKVNPVEALWIDLKALGARAVVFGGLVIVGAGIAVSLILLFPPYWHHPGWSDLPKLPHGVDERGRHWIGAREAELVVVEFSDYECPHCRRAHKHTRLMAAKYPKKVRLIHRHLPLDSACNRAVKRKFHERACEFAKAAECAAEQGEFWKMNDALFSVQDNIKAAAVDIERIAVQLGLDRSALKECMASRKVMSRIQADLKEAQKRRVSGTPTFFIGDQPYPGTIPEPAFENAVKQASKSVSSNSASASKLSGSPASE